MIDRVGIVGAGTMGRGIAQVAAQAGLEVQLHDTAPEALARARDAIVESLERAVGKATLAAQDRDRILSRLHLAGNAEALAPCDYVIEAIVERVDAKRALLATLDGVLAPDAIIASNTSAISITLLAAATRRPDRVLGMHFMNPVPRMRLVELVRGHATSDASMATARRLTEALGKTAVEAADSPGFISNRVLMPMINEAMFAVMEGVGSAEDIDTVMKLGMNHPIGPLALADLIGLDVCLDIMEVLREGFADSKYRPCPLLRRLVAAGHLGRKTGQGFYEY